MKTVGFHQYTETIPMHYNHYHIAVQARVGEESEEEMPEWDDVDEDGIDDGVLYGVCLMITIIIILTNHSSST